MSLTIQDILKVGREYKTVILMDDYQRHCYQAHCESMLLLRDFIRHMRSLDIRLINKVEWNVKTNKYFIKFYYHPE